MNFSELTHPDVILGIYKEIKESRIDAFTDEERPLPRGWDGLTQAAFERQLDQHVSAISRKLNSGRYTFRPFLFRDIPKTGGGTRKVAYSTVRDRIVQEIIYRYLYGSIDSLLLDSCHSYRKAKSPHTAIFQLMAHGRNGYNIVFESDFRSFFDSLDHERICSLLRPICDELVMKVIWRYLRTPQVGAEESKVKNLPSRKLGVPQGGVLSGLLANLYLNEFDHAIAKTKSKLVRYADDFLVLSKSEEDHRVGIKLVEQYVDGCPGLELHPEKTCERTSLGDGVEFVGFKCTSARISVREANIQKFKERLRADVFKKHIPNAGKPVERQQKKLIRHLNAKIKGASDGEQTRSWITFFRICNDMEQLNLLNRWIWQSVSHWNKAHFGVRLSHSEIRNLGLRSLVTEYWSVKRNISRHRNSSASS